MALAYTEDQLVEQPAIALFTELGWQAVSAMEEEFGPGGTLGREALRAGASVSRRRISTQARSALLDYDSSGLERAETDHRDAQGLRSAVSLL